MRSLLFTPGTRGDRVKKALERRAGDVVVADLEDAVAPDEKENARSVVRDTLTIDPEPAPGENDPKRPPALRAVRINTLESGLGLADLRAVFPARPDLVVFPKAHRVADVVALDEALYDAERAHGAGAGSTGLVLIVESAEGVLQAQRLARAAPRVQALAFGAEDLAADAGLRRSSGNMEVWMARSRIALAASAAGIVAVDQVFVDIEDIEGLQREAREARNLGYGGKMVIHPNQTKPVHEAFAPTEEELEEAKRLVSAVDEGNVGAGGVLRFEGRMIDVPLVEQARRLLVEHEEAQRADEGS